MISRASVIDELEHVIEDGSSTRHSDIARRVTDLFVTGAEHFSEEHVSVFAEVMERLIDKIETRALIELGERLSAVRNAPATIMRRLANDDEMAVAGPVLSRSEQLSDDDLVSIAETKSQAHLLAISNRKTLPESVTDVLVRRGNGEVVSQVTGNIGAKFSESGFGALVRRAEADGTLAEKVVQRPDIPPHLLCKMVVDATETVRRRLLAAVHPALRADIQKVIEEVSGRVAEELSERRDYAHATRQVLLAYPDGRLTERDVLTFALERRVDETVAALSLASAVPADIVDQLMNDSRAEPVLIMSKALGYGWPTARAILQLRGNVRLSPDAMTEACDEFNRLSRSTAQRVLQYWLIKQSGPGASGASD
ncbi:MAG TPA: DUF2336 domain-containing protein [Xanthobacteraceae bacterium]|jgi:uncharacterized protein (DUF2336 family)|nr:DUF2336 domain-containing protein [Xanthobacteraceae bacterium]